MPPAWRSRSPPFKVLVHTPSKQTSPLTGSYTLYSVTSLFKAPTNPNHHARFSTADSMMPSSSSRTITQRDAPTLPEFSPDLDDDSTPTIHVTVQRRFSHFVFLHTALSRTLPGIALPPLPDKQYAGRFNDDFIEARRGDLERWLARIIRHPLARYSDVTVFFLSCDNDIVGLVHSVLHLPSNSFWVLKEWKRDLPKYLAPPPAPGPAFFGNIYHPSWNFDADEAEEVVDKFDRHLRAVGQGVQGLRGVFNKVREANVGAYHKCVPPAVQLMHVS